LQGKDVARGRAKKRCGEDISGFNSGLQSNQGLGATAKVGELMAEEETERFPTVNLVCGRQSLQVSFGSAQSCTLGSDPDSGMFLQGPGVCVAHARLLWSDGKLLVESIESAPVTLNGQVVTERAPVTSGDWLALGQTVLQVAVRHEGGTGAQRAKIASTLTPGTAPQPVAAPRVVVPGTGLKTISIGRLPENDVSIPSPIVSRQHARIVCDSGSYFIEDLGSTNGTFIDGRRVDARVRLGGGELVQFGSFAFVFADGSLREVEGAGQVRVEVRDLRKTVTDVETGKNKDLLADINLAINPGEFVGIFGTSGSGKSTLMDALNGRRPGSTGGVLYNGTDLYQSFDLFKSIIGYVPQQDIVHRKITIRNALAYTARLRLPEDTSGAEIEKYIERVLTRVGLADKVQQPIDTPAPLSGGQLKRVSLAIELVSNPSILFLDEATSGLDAGTDKKMMRLFADLAADGKTVVCVTHTLENIEACHLVVVLHKGRLVYFGPPSGVTEHFRIGRLSDVYEALEAAPAERWAEQYDISALNREYVARRLSGSDPATQAAASVSDVASRRARAHWFDWRQTGILMRRYLDLILSDRRNLAVLLAQAPIIGVVVGLVFDTRGPLPVRAAAESQVMFMLVISAIWFGCLNSAREVVKELPIYERERSVNLGIGPYLMSKLIPLAGLCAVQCIILLGVVSLLIPIPGSFAARLVPLFLTGMAATTMGLTVSAMVTSADKAVGVIPILLIPQVILSNAIVTLSGASESIAKASMVSFWGFDCVKTTLASEVRALVSVRGSYWGDLFMLAVFLTGFLAAAVAGLKWKDRHR